MAEGHQGAAAKLRLAAEGGYFAPCIRPWRMPVAEGHRGRPKGGMQGRFCLWPKATVPP